VKNPMNYQQAYAGVMKAAFVLDTPGPTPANTNALPYAAMTNDWFPATPDLEVEEPEVIVLRRRGC